MNTMTLVSKWEKHVFVGRQRGMDELKAVDEVECLGID